MMRIRKGAIAACFPRPPAAKGVLLIFAAVLGLAYSRAEAQTADVILHSGLIVTVDEAFSKASAVAVKGGEFIFVGSDAGVMAHKGRNTRMINLEGRTVLPGLIDTHVHQLDGAINLRNVDLFGARSIADVVKAIERRVAESEPGEWVIASSGWHESLLEEGRLPTRFELDTVSPDNPVVIPRGGHVLTVNTKALEAAGINDETPSPEGGVIVRNEDGEVTGVLFESAISLVHDVMPSLSDLPPDETRRLLKKVMKKYNSYGIVAVTEPGLSDEEIEIYRQADRAREMTVRTHVLYRYRDAAGLERALRAYDRDDFSSQMLRFDGVKYLRDGGVEGGRFYHPYEIVEGEQLDPEYRGKLLLAEGMGRWIDDLKRIAAEGWQVQSHAVGDEAIDVVVDAYEAVDNDPRFDVGELRWAIMHIFAPTESALRKMPKLDILATAQDHPVLLGHNMKRYFGEERAAYSIPLRDLIDRGILVGGGTDEPVAPIDPFLSLWWMTTRGTLNGYALGPDQAITIREALKLYTINNAYIQGVEEERGSIEVGKRADLVVISHPILDIRSEHIRGISALMTMLDGEIVYKSEDF